MTQIQPIGTNLPDLTPDRKLTFRALGILLLSTIVWGVLLIPSRDLATVSVAQVTVWETAMQTPLLSALTNTYFMLISATPFTIILGLSGGWAFYFIQAHRAAIIFCALPLLSFIPFALQETAAYLYLIG